MTSRLHKSKDIIGDRYRVIDYVGEGGMQEVYRATDEKLGRIVALKAPKNRSAAKRFQRSAAMSAKVTHPNVAKTLDYIDDEDGQHLVEEFIFGQDLKSRLDEYFDVLDPHLAAHIFHHLVRGVNAVHQVGVFHRDLKPSNIMVSTDPNVRDLKITDFGIAKLAEDEIERAMKDETATVASMTAVGAIPYMAPELIDDPKTATLASDIWSLSAILYHLLAGEPPYGTGLAAVKRIIDAKEPEMPKLLKAKQDFRPLSTDLWELLLSCLREDPTERPTAEQLVEACGDLCYSTADRFEAIVTAYPVQGRNWDFVEPLDDDASVFFHLKSYYGGQPKVGGRVSVASFPGRPSPRAFPVLPLRDFD